MSGHEGKHPSGASGHPEHEQNQSHAGNGTVNHGPEEQGPDGLHPDEQAPEGNGPAERAPQGTASDDDAPDGLASDELALRRLLHQAVEEIEPSDGTLDHLRRAVPARRARKRQAAVGMAAAALFIGTAVPALVHVSNSTGSDANPSIAGNSEQTQGGQQGKGQSSGSADSSGSSGTSKDKDEKDKDKQDADNGASAGSTSGADPTASAAGTAACTAGQLGNVTQSVGAPDAAGAVYGSFTVSNVSGTGCTVTGPGSVGASAQGAADPSKIAVARHVAGDAAAGLPDPAQEAASLVLRPGTSYVVKFAWVPSETCPVSGGPSPDPSPTEGATDGGASTDSGTSAQLLKTDGTVDGSVLVSHTSEGGSVSVSVTVGNACAGTVYWAGLLNPV
ncbi:hypothetical protein ACFV6E_05990 [Streptomyces sp. NPDC059785]|uniref:hypothetical protein n=1 Tax=unclassified Streptomyces TaxID=2593676 RepID=UPI0036646A03